MVLTFLHERRKRIEKAQAEGYAEGYAEGRAEAYAEEYAEGRAEGYAEGHSEWADWNRRREEAERRGERFDEPHPRLDDAAR